jgi:hypothetical protein
VIKEIEDLPDNARLTPEQIAELEKNLDRLLRKSLPAAKDPQTVAEAIKTLPRFRFLDQIPGGREKVIEALKKYGVPFE